jgi:hypothetical protein
MVCMCQKDKKTLRRAYDVFWRYFIVSKLKTL